VLLSQRWLLPAFWSVKLHDGASGGESVCFFPSSSASTPKQGTSMGKAGQFMLGLLALVVGAAVAGWIVWRTLKKSDDPGRMLFKWIATLIILAIIVGLGISLHGSGPGAAFVVPIAGAAFGVVLGIIWAPHLGALLAKPFTSFYDGGGQEVELRPFYSIARAKQKRGNYPEAIAEIRKQLERFPEDYEGWMFLAEIYGDNLKDNSQAQSCIAEILSHQGHADKNIAFALNRSADWHLGLASDREAARESLERIAALFPGTELGHAAAQRAAHLTTGQMLAEQKERPRLAVTHYDERIGLKGEVADPRRKPEEPPDQAAKLVAHLNQYPEDAEAREQLAAIYAEHYARMDLVADQFEQLIATPGATQKEIARWLNRLADFQITIAQDRAGAETALQRVSALFPKTAVASQAESRLAYLEGELRKNQKSQALKLGSYDENIGLKGRVPKPPC